MSFIRCSFPLSLHHYKSPGHTDLSAVLQLSPLARFSLRTSCLIHFLQPDWIRIESLYHRKSSVRSRLKLVQSWEALSRVFQWKLLKYCGLTFPDNGGSTVKALGYWSKGQWFTPQHHPLLTLSAPGVRAQLPNQLESMKLKGMGKGVSSPGFDGNWLHGAFTAVTYPRIKCKVAVNVFYCHKRTTPTLYA